MRHFEPSVSIVGTPPSNLTEEGNRHFFPFYQMRYGEEYPQ